MFTATYRWAIGIISLVLEYLVIYSDITSKKIRGLPFNYEHYNDHIHKLIIKIIHKLIIKIVRITFVQKLAIKMVIINFCS